MNTITAGARRSDYVSERSELETDMPKVRGLKDGPRNHILSRLKKPDYDRLSKHLETVELKFKQTLYDYEDRVDFVYFVESGLVSLVTVFRDGDVVETGIVGNEGMAGLPAFLGMERAPARALCQIPGTVKRLPLAILREDQRRAGPLSQLLLRYAGASMTMLAQSAACNRAHAVEQRLSRWLLMTLNRIGNHDLCITQEFLSQMLGVRRPTLNGAAASLQKRGLIRCSRGKVAVLHRKGLERASCECYERIEDEFLRALGPFPDPHR